MWNDLADGRTMGAHPEAFSGRAHSRRAGRKPVSRSGFVDTDHRRAMAAVLSKLQNGSSPFSELVSQRSVAELLTDVANETRERGVLDEEECFGSQNLPIGPQYSPNASSSQPTMANAPPVIFTNRLPALKISESSVSRADIFEVKQAWRDQCEKFDFDPYLSKRAG